MSRNVRVRVPRSAPLLAAAALLAAAETHAAEPAAAPAGARQQSQVIVPGTMKSAYENWGYAPAIVTRDGTIYVSGVVSGLHGTGTYEERYAAGFERALDTIGRVLKEAGASLDDVVDITTYHTDIARQLDTAIKVRMKNDEPAAPGVDRGRHDGARGAGRPDGDPRDREAAGARRQAVGMRRARAYPIAFATAANVVDADLPRPRAALSSSQPILGAGLRVQDFV